MMLRNHPYNNAVNLRGGGGVNISLMRMMMMITMMFFRLFLFLFFKRFRAELCDDGRQRRQAQAHAANFLRTANFCSGKNF